VVLILVATIGMAMMSSTVHNMTNDFQAVFSVNAAIALIVLIVGWLTFEANRPEPGSANEGGLR
jgi:hypothetical protein